MAALHIKGITYNTRGRDYGPEREVTLYDSASYDRPVHMSITTGAARALRLVFGRADMVALRDWLTAQIGD